MIMEMACHSFQGNADFLQKISYYKSKEHSKKIAQAENILNFKYSPVRCIKLSKENAITALDMGLRR